MGRKNKKPVDSDKYLKSFYRLNKELLPLYGAEITTFLCILIWHYENLAGGKLPKIKRGDFFYVEYDKMEEITGLYERQQLKILDILENDLKVIKRRASRIKGAKEIQIDFVALDNLVTRTFTVEKHLTRLYRKVPLLVGKAKKDRDAQIKIKE